MPTSTSTHESKSKSAAAKERTRARLAEAAKDWLFAPDAACILACSEKAVSRLAALGLIGTRLLPGTMPKYCRADCEALAARYTTPGRPDAAAAVT